ncbi:MAG: acylase [Aureispira sp.]|nr:acylase [Aureispira sp.]
MKLSLLLLTLISILNTSYAQTTDKINPKDVTIARDKWGVPHIYGKTDADAVYGFVWAQAEDNFELMQHSWAATKGRAAEILGKDGAIFDVLAHMLEIDRVFEEQYEKGFSPEFKEIIRAYAQGANDYARTHPKEVLLKGIFPLSEREIVAGYLLGNIIMTGTAFEVGKIFGNQLDQYTQPTGSNGFAFSRDITKENKTFFCSNSHQPIEGVVSWYEVHMNSEEGWNMLGATFTLGITPFVGTNQNLGWTHTVNQPDLTDIYKLTMHPKKKLHYKYDGEWFPLEVKKLNLKVKVIGLKIPVSLKFFKSKHGMVMKNKTGFYALRFSANQRITASEQWYRMNKASNFEEFKDALSMVSIPCFNVVYADKDNNIYNLGNGLIPNNRKENYNWHGILRGDTSDNVWQPEFYKFEELPQIENPSCGWIFNSNNTPFTATYPKCDLDSKDYPNHLMGYLEKETNRSIRFEEMMDAFKNKKLSYEDFKRMKFDIQYPDSTFYTYNIENLDDITLLDPAEYPDLKEVLEMINTWDRKPDKDDKTAAVFSVAFTYIIDELADRSNLLGTNTLPKETFVDALRKAKKFMLKHYGRLDVPFGEVHIHRREKGSDVSFPSSGMPENLAAMAYTRDKKQKGKLRTYSGESFILIAQFDENGLNQVETINAFGSSNRPESPHYTDQMEMFVNRQLKPMTLDKEEILKNAVKTYSPEPKP